MSVTIRIVAIAALTAGLVTSCGGGPTGPSAERYRDPRLFTYCRSDGGHVNCTAILEDVPNYGSRRDVTRIAKWIVSDPTIAQMEEGIVLPISRGAVKITAEFEQWSSRFHHWFLVDPTVGAQGLYRLAGTVNDGRTGGRLTGVTVQVVAGYNAGLSSVTNQFGAFNIEPLLVHETVRVRAMKEGYVSSDTTACITSPVNPPFDPPGCRGVVEIVLTPTETES